jgi:hypothetical protein
MANIAAAIVYCILAFVQEYAHASHAQSSTTSARTRDGGCSKENPRCFAGLLGINCLTQQIVDTLLADSNSAAGEVPSWLRKEFCHAVCCEALLVRPPCHLPISVSTTMPQPSDGGAGPSCMQLRVSLTPSRRRTVNRESGRPLQSQCIKESVTRPQLALGPRGWQCSGFKIGKAESSMDANQRRCISWPVLGVE